MKCSTALFCSWVFLFSAYLACGQEPKSPTAAAEEKYGVYPIAYRELITRWLETQLLDPASAQIEWLDDPKPIEIKGSDGRMFFGYIVEFKVNSRNRFGTYTGKQARRVYIRNGEVAAGGRVTT